MSIFRFKYFSVSHDFGMKIGTDAILLGCWVQLDNAARILDIGTGTGIIALMMAQRSCFAEIVGIDIDEESVNEARNNVLQSTWNNKIKILQGDFRDENFVKSLGKFDIIVSNPPFFIHSMKSPFENRNTVRHSDSLPFDVLIQNARKSLTKDGKLYIILPENESNIFTKTAEKQHLYPEKFCKIYPYPNAMANRKIISYQQKQERAKEETLFLRNADRSYSNEYKLFTKEFYLNLDGKHERK